MASTTAAEDRRAQLDTEECSLVIIAQDVQEERAGEDIRPDALHEANIFHSSFFNKPLCLPAAAAETSSSKFNKPKNERLCLGGHRETIFGISFSPDGIYLATASQDSTIAIWSVKSQKLVTTLKEGMNVKYECLRVAWSTGREKNEKYLLASAGADGIARLWSASVPSTTAPACANDVEQEDEQPMKWQCVGMLDHYMFEQEDRNSRTSLQEEEDENNDRPQIYALQFMHDRTTSKSATTATKTNDILCTNSANDVILLTSTNDCIYLWDIVAVVVDECIGGSDCDDIGSKSNIIHSRTFRLQTMIHFTHIKDETTYNINTFGGERNPDNVIYIFDASFCETNGWLGVALSDGTCRVLCRAIETVNGNGDSGKRSSLSYQERCVLGLPPNYFGNNNRGGGHLTALSWDTSGTRLATCFASGRVILWSIHVVNDGMNRQNDVLLEISCISVLEGGECALFDWMKFLLYLRLILTLLS